MSCLSLWHLIVRLRLRGMHEVGKLDSVLDEEDRNVIADNVPVSLICIEFYGKASNIANSVLGNVNNCIGGRETLQSLQRFLENPERC